MKKKRTDRINSLLREVISEVINFDINNPEIPKLSVTYVDVAPDLKTAKVYISLIGTDEKKNHIIELLQKESNYIFHIASKKVVLKYFPKLTFILDDSLEKQLRIEKIINDIHNKSNNDE